LTLELGQDLVGGLGPGKRLAVMAAAFSYTVTEADTAAAVGSGEVPVLATRRMLALAERATVAALTGVLEAGATTVGTRLSWTIWPPARSRPRWRSTRWWSGLPAGGFSSPG
jgi:hypothetical protein